MLKNVHAFCCDEKLSSRVIIHCLCVQNYTGIVRDPMDQKTLREVQNFNQEPMGFDRGTVNYRANCVMAFA